MAWDSSIGTFALNDLVTHTQLNKVRNNLNYLKDPDVLYVGRASGSGDYTTTGTSFADLGAPFSYTATFKAGKALFLFVGNASNSPVVVFDLLIDGTSVSGGNGVARSALAAANPILVARVLDLSAASHTIKLQWKVETAGTGTMRANGRFPFMYVREIAWTP